jgi:virulence factor Mce-like protein
MSPFVAGVILIVLVGAASYFAFTQANPFANPYEMTATFNTANSLQPDSPVRIAGVDVGIVTGVEPLPDGSGAARVTMEIRDNGLPLHEDAELKIRPRIFLEGNFFVDVRPGSPSAPELEDGGTIPVNQTATPVQFGQVLAALQTDTREDLRTLFEEYAFRGLRSGGAKDFNRSIKYWEGAYKNSSLANDALLGTQEGDLNDVVRGQQKTFDALSSSPADLRGLVTNFNTTAAAFAREDDALRATIPALRDVLTTGQPALRSLSDTLPGVRAFAMDALPGVRSSRTTIPATFPFIRQTRLLFSQAELRGLVDDLRPTIPALARLNDRTIPLLNQNRALARCQNQVVLDWVDDIVPNQEPGTGERDFAGAADATDQGFYQLAPRSFIGLSGESRTGDANGQAFRVAFGLDNATTLVRPPDVDNIGLLGENAEDVFITLGNSTNERSRPAPPQPFGPDYRRPSFRPDFPCELSEKPDLNAASVDGAFDSAGVPRTVTDLLDDVLPFKTGAPTEQATTLLQDVLKIPIADDAYDDGIIDTREAEEAGLTPEAIEAIGAPKPSELPEDPEQTDPDETGSEPTGPKGSSTPEAAE